MLAYAMKYYREIFLHIENLSKEKGVKFRIIVESSKENAPFLNSLRYCDKRHLNNIVESFQISDHIACEFHLFNKQHERLDEILWTNRRYLVERKQILFNSLWKMAIPVIFEKMS